MRASCFDFVLDSELPLGELTLAAADDPRPIVTVRVGAVPASLAGAADAEFGLQARDDEALLSVPDHARFLIRDGREIVVEPHPDAAERDVRLFLLGSALGVLAYQRGLLPLHANAVVIDGGAVAFTGTSGAGKSTLAAHFARAGHRVLTDDVCALSFDEAGRPLAWPGLPRVKLWGEAVEAFGHDRDGLDRVIEGHDKWHVPLPIAANPRPVQLRRLYTLSKAEPGTAGTVTPLRGGEALSAVMTNTYRQIYIRTLGLSEWHFRRSAALLGHLQVFAATRAWGFDVFEREAAALLAHAAA